MAVIKQHSESAGLERTGHFTSYVKKKRMRRHSANSNRELSEGNNDVEAVIDVKNFKYVTSVWKNISQYRFGPYSHIQAIFSLR